MNASPALPSACILSNSHDATKVSLNRQSYLWENGKRRDDPQCPWQAGEILGKSLAKTHELLDGSVDGQPHPEKERGAQIREGILAEAELFLYTARWDRLQSLDSIVRGI